MVPGLWCLVVYLIRDILVFFCREFVYLYVRTWYVSATIMVVFS